MNEEVKDEVILQKEVSEEVITNNDVNSTIEKDQNAEPINGTVVEEDKEPESLDQIEKEFEEELEVVKKDADIQQKIAELTDNLEKEGVKPGTPQYDKLMRMRNFFLDVIDFRFLLKHRRQYFYIPKKYTTAKSRRGYCHQLEKDAIAKLTKNRKYVYKHPTKAFKIFLNVFEKEHKKEAYNWYYVFCHFIATRDINQFAYQIVFTLNRMAASESLYLKEGLGGENADKNKFSIQSTKNFIIENYSGDCIKWKKGF